MGRVICVFYMRELGRGTFDHSGSTGYGRGRVQNKSDRRKTLVDMCRSMESRVGSERGQGRGSERPGRYGVGISYYKIKGGRDSPDQWGVRGEGGMSRPSGRTAGLKGTRRRGKYVGRGIGS